MTISKDFSRALAKACGWLILTLTLSWTILWTIDIKIPLGRYTLVLFITACTVPLFKGIEERCEFVACKLLGLPAAIPQRTFGALLQTFFIFAVVFSGILVPVPAFDLGRDHFIDPRDVETMSDAAGTPLFWLTLFACLAFRTMQYKHNQDPVTVSQTHS